MNEKAQIILRLCNEFICCEECVDTSINTYNINILNVEDLYILKHILLYNYCELKREWDCLPF